VALLGCPQQAVSPPTPAPDTDLCGSMCNYLLLLGCEEGKPVYDSDIPVAPGHSPGDPNESCEQFCQKQQDNGIFLNPRCVMKAKSCLEIEQMRPQDCSKQ
jgi:hypothetical protein